jgi:hypothetical protein
MATQYGFGKIITDGLVLALDAADRNSYVSGSATWVDLTSYNNNGTRSGSNSTFPDFVTDYGGAINFNGLSGSYVSVVNETGISGSVAITVETILSINSNTFNNILGATAMYIIYRQNTRIAQFESFAQTYVSGSFGAICASSTGTQKFITASSPVFNTPIMLTSTFDSSSVKTYINGALQSQTATGFNLDFGNNHTTKIGRALATGSTFDAYFNGKIYSTNIYNRTLSDAEILQNFNAQKARFGIEQPAPPYTPPYFPGLYKTEYSGYFNDVVSFFATATSTSAGVQQSPIEDTSTSLRDSFSIQWLGYFLPPSTGNYIFYTVSDDASYLWVGDNATSSFTTVNANVNNGGTHPSQERFGSASLTAGVYYPLRIQFGESGGGNNFSLLISSSAIAKTSSVSDLIFYNSATNGI